MGTSGSLSKHANASIDMFTARAKGYDDASGGWHKQLAQEFVEWLPPKSGDAILDLACGTGLVTILQAEAAGENGIVIGVDVTAAMLNEARTKSIKPNSASITWIECDVTKILDLESIQHVVQQRGGFDIISCCSALVLLPDPRSAIKAWASLLRVGGQMIIDVPTEDRTLQYLFTVSLMNAVGSRFPFDRDWIIDIHSLESLYAEAGLTASRSLKTRSYMPEQLYQADQCDEVFEQKIQTMYKSFLEQGKQDEAQQAWRDIWEQNIRQNGQILDGHWLYVSIGKRTAQKFV